MLVRGFQGALESVLNSLDEVAHHPPETEYYAWHPLPLSEWAVGMEGARNYVINQNRCWTGREAFLDVGSGLGTKMALASALGWGCVEGVERYEPYAVISRSRWPHPVAVVDAFDFDEYDRFDLVYSYRLCIELDRQRQLTDYMVRRMKPGSLLFLAGGPDPTDLEEVAPGVWRV